MYMLWGNAVASWLVNSSPYQIHVQASSRCGDIMFTVLDSSLESNATQMFRLDISRPVPVDFQTSPPFSTILLFLTSKHPFWFSLLLECFQHWSNTTQGLHCAHLSKKQTSRIQGSEGGNHVPNVPWHIPV